MSKNLIKYRKVTMITSAHIHKLLEYEYNFCPVNPYLVNYNLLGKFGTLITDGEYVLELEGVWRGLEVGNYEDPPKVIRESIECFLFD